MEAKGCKEHTVRMTKLCQSDYKKASRRMDRRLRELVEFELDSCTTIPTAARGLSGI